MFAFSDEGDAGDAAPEFLDKDKAFKNICFLFIPHVYSSVVGALDRPVDALVKDEVLVGLLWGAAGVYQSRRA